MYLLSHFQVLEELAMQDFQSNPSTTAMANRARVSRKGSGASRSSRSRSSPRLAGRNQLTNTTSSSDEGKGRWVNLG